MLQLCQDKCFEAQATLCKKLNESFHYEIFCFQNLSKILLLHPSLSGNAPGGQKIKLHIWLNKLKRAGKILSKKYIYK